MVGPEVSRGAGGKSAWGGCVAPSAWNPYKECGDPEFLGWRLAIQVGGAG
jgi:hypothetical protein